MTEVRATIGGFTSRGYLALIAAMFGLVISIVAILFVTWVGDRGELARSLIADGERALASNAEVYRCPGRCADDFVAVIELPEGPEKLEIMDVDFEREGLAEGRWSPAPSPYDEPFSVLYDPEDVRSMMTEIDALVSEGDTAPWGVVWVLAGWTAVWTWPAVRATRAAVRRYRLERGGVASPLSAPDAPPLP